MDCFAGSPAVSERFWSNSLKEFVSVRKVQIVTLGMTIGILILNKIWLLVAPSMRAASTRSTGTFCKPAI